MSEPLVTIVVSAGGASEQMLTTCLDALERHQSSTESKVVVVAPWHQAGIPARVCQDAGIEFRHFEVDADNLSGSRVHAAVLDRMVPHIDTTFLLTLDADCFPVADDWLDALVAPIGGGASVSGILHPYAPPLPVNMTSLEYRIRSQLCNWNTHVACQLVGMQTLKKLGVGFSDGDDTGLAIPVKARQMGMRVTGLPLTGCADADQDWQEKESNRECCLLFGDKVYHHGGGCREEQSRGDPLEAWNPVREQILAGGGAEFLLGGSRTYRYSFSHEEEVAEQMVSRIMRGMQIYLQTHNRAFKE